MTFQTAFRSLATVLLLTGSATCLAQDIPGPGPEHEKLAELVGNWKAEMTAAGAPSSTGTSTFRMILGGMWLESDFEGDFAGQKFSGRGLDSYDAGKQEYVSVWVDSMTGYPTVFRGNYDKTGKILTMTGESMDPAGNSVKMKSVSTTVDNDHMNYKMYMVVGDTESEMVSIKYTRQK